MFVLKRYSFRGLLKFIALAAPFFIVFQVKAYPLKLKCIECGILQDSTKKKKFRLHITPKDSALFNMEFAGGGVYSDTIRAGKKRKVHFAIVPGPVYSPLSSFGLAVLPVVVYNINPADTVSPPSSTSALFYFSASGSYTVGLSQSLFLKQDNWRLRATAGIGDINYRFYGIGRSPSSLRHDESDYIDLGNLTKAFTFEIYRRIYKRYYFGLAYDYVNFNIDGQTDAETQRLDSLKIPTSTQRYNTFSPSFLYDSRDNIFWSTKGIYSIATFVSAFQYFGSESSFWATDWFFNQYISLKPYLKKNVIFAWRAYWREGYGDVPFNQLAFYGSGTDLRGYVVGKFVNKSQLDFQGELRWDLWQYINLAVFAGTGKSYDKLERFGDFAWLPSAGVGAYIRLIPTYNVRARVSIAFAKEGWNWYFGLNQAF